MQRTRSTAPTPTRSLRPSTPRLGRATPPCGNTGCAAGKRARWPWQRGCIDESLRDIADDKVAGILITDTRMQRIHHPDDGGADVFLTTPDERDQMRDRHADWLSSHPSGL
ncbi:DUF3885 domain-containing protein [Streptomyces phaeochromogenes]